MIPIRPPSPSDLRHVSSPITVSISLDALTRNFHQIRQWITPSIKILAVIKADAYGHGAIPVAQTLEHAGIFGFGVASVMEGITLREHQIHCPILVMGPILPQHLSEIIRHQLTPVISRAEILQQLIELLFPRATPFPIHLKVDTGLHRLGFENDEALSLLSKLTLSTPLIEIEGLLSHFADADNQDHTLTNLQIQKFLAFIDQAKQLGVQPPILHMANSAGILFHPTAHLGMVRPGLMLYGYAPLQESFPQSLTLEPVMQATTYLAHLRSLQPGEIVGYNALFRTRRPSQIAVLPVGYTHGFPRHLTGVGHVLIKGEPAPIIGKICMDMMMVDVTDIPHPTVGEEVVLLGKQGTRKITAEDHARWLNTIPYEVLCGIGGKANRIYLPPTLDSSPSHTSTQSTKKILE
ncbi:alanine racemase [Candidatus Nitrospira allomarina]|uniref:Alanine racemase n=1 Tax=Candidatus Nitrospira allomarina TaxID=3020900 RepID=A0AA96JRC9_9BACT|nr:alanine racemase [Candidatus Nitrospira allomarina]WNM56968.1 alanine racemase [Candidatus Nitrospira allomarina]